MTSSQRHSIYFVNTGWLSIISSLVNIGCKLVKLLYSQARNVLNSSRNRSAVTSLMTSSWRNSIYFVNTDWLSFISSLVNIRCKLIKILCLQAQIYYFSRNRRTMTSLMTSSWRRSIGFVTTCIPSTMRSLVKIGWKMVELSCSQARGYILPEMTSLWRHWWRHDNKNQ